MQVTQTQDHVTHAIIGGGKVASFGINDSAEFFRILSSSLYSDKKLAVIREILCNAWDAHIEHGVTDKAVQVSLDEAELTIRDFGPGMSPSDIHKLYTTYGGTSKIANDNVTGGFGLGSKAPFAYVDHFEVTSHHKGKKTIYRMSLSNAEVDGKPSVMTIMDLPSDETGIQVRIELKDKWDVDSFKKVIRRVVQNGEMNVELNGYKQDTLPFSSAPHNFIIMPRDKLGGNARVRIRYGHVIYPLDADDKLNMLRQEAEKFLDMIAWTRTNNQGGRDWTLVLYAQPGKLTVTPSRESLSMTDATIGEVTRLLSQFLGFIKNGITEDNYQFLQEAIAQCWADGVPGMLCNPKKAFPNTSYFRNLSADLPEIITNLRDASRWYMSGQRYPDNPRFYIDDMKLRVQALINQKFGDEKLNKSYLAALGKVGNLRIHQSNWFYKKILWPLIRDIRAHDSVKLSNMLLCHYGLRTERSYQKDTILTPVTRATFPYLRDALPFLRRFVILSHSRQAVLDDSQYKLNKFYGYVRSSFAYIVPRNPKRIQEARDFFTGMGLEVVDLTPDQTSIVDDPDYEKPAPKAKPKGLVSLKGLAPQGHIQMNLSWDENTPRLEHPKTYVVISSNREKVDELSGFGKRAIRPIIELFGEECAVVATKQTAEKLQAKGIPELRTYIIDKVVEAYKTDKDIERHYRNYKASDKASWHDTEAWDFLRLIRSDAELRKAFKLPEPCTGKAALFMILAEYLNFAEFQTYDHRNRKHIVNDQLKAIYDRVQSFTASKALLAVIRKLESPIFDALNVGEISSLLNCTSQTPEAIHRQEVARRLVRFAMKG